MLEEIKKDTLEEAFKLLKDNLDPPYLYEETLKYYAMELSSGEFVDCFWMRLLREAKLTQHSARRLVKKTLEIS